ncbi:hypothetical protein EYF80_017104 [Liparis tanakae]|uniref:Uncharacterized protein n=1 Tax=Liparis tanakae TaxID=230148 RepID=A0A4Z2I5C2_9TELE|nr:hypothetical protein EYF80_017104 [Liparis tanakae]
MRAPRIHDPANDDAASATRDNWEGHCVRVKLEQNDYTTLKSVFVRACTCACSSHATRRAPDSLSAAVHATTHVQPI